ncbi:hypothetical protein DKX38_002795 [Salix brachista]|uniref:Uncharacterized protein n=1 Tax=Salix brachista TaxID=2182728 RepID=A0A5N5NNV9_9ROSI|nr:hypothetical protein DKX38_002795 [Salix brachista]
MESENPDDRQRIAAAEEQKKRKRAESNKKYYQKIKKESKQAQLKTVQNECSRCKAQLESYEKSVMKPLLDEACKFRKLVLEPGESSGHAIEAFEKQTDLVNSLSWELLKMVSSLTFHKILAVLCSGYIHFEQFSTAPACFPAYYAL